MNILITGSNGQLGQEFRRLQNKLKVDFIFTDKNEIDLCNYQNIHDYLNGIKLDFIINCAAYTNVSKSEIEKELSFNVNSNGVKNLVNYCEKTNTKLIHISTDYVYNSDSNNPIKENCKVDPINHYGFTKREGEKFIENSKLKSIVIRTSWLYSKFGNNFVNTIIEKSKYNNEICVVNDQFGCPTYAKDLALDIINITKSKSNFNFKNKIFNYSNLGNTNWFEFARAIKNIFGFKSKIKPVSSNFYYDGVKRPKYSITCKQKVIKTFNLKLRDWNTSLIDYLNNDF